jgi:integrase
MPHDAFGVLASCCPFVGRERKVMQTEKLPRGIRRRGRSLVVYLTLADGREQKRSVGCVTLKTAVRQREIWQREIEESRYVKPVPRTDRVLFSEICDSAAEYYKNYTRAWDAAEGRIARFKEWWPSRTAESITTAEIDAQLLANVAPRGLQWTRCTSNEYRVTLLRIFALAVDAGTIAVNPVIKSKRHKLENARTREMSFAEEDAIRAAIRKLCPDKEPEFDLALHLGCRRSNMYGQHNAKRARMEPLQWSDVHLDFRVVTFQRSKSGKSYRVPINKTALTAFKRLRQRGDGTGAVIRKPRPGRTDSDGRELRSSRKWFAKVLSEAKIKDLTWHDFRHTFGSRLRAAKVQIEDIRYLLGHGAKSITERYAHANLDMLREAVGTLDRKATKQTGTKTGTSSVLRFQAS